MNLTVSGTETDLLLLAAYQHLYKPERAKCSTLAAMGLRFIGVATYDTTFEINSKGCQETH